MKKKFVTRKQEGGESTAAKQPAEIVNPAPSNPRQESGPIPVAAPEPKQEATVFSSISATGGEQFVSEATRKRNELLASRGADDEHRAAPAVVIGRNPRGGPITGAKLTQLPLDRYLKEIKNNLPDLNIQFEITTDTEMKGPISRFLITDIDKAQSKNSWKCSKLDEVIGFKKLTDHTALLSLSAKPRVIDF